MTQLFRRALACVLVFLLLIPLAYAAGSDFNHFPHADFPALFSHTQVEPRTTAVFYEALSQIQITDQSYFHVAAPNKVYSLTNISEETDCYLAVRIMKYTPTPASEIRRRYQYDVTNISELSKLPEGDTPVYFARSNADSVSYLANDTRWVSGRSDGTASDVLRVQKGQTIQFTLPDVKDGDIVLITIEAYYRLESGTTAVSSTSVSVLVSTDSVAPAPPSGGGSLYSEIPVYGELEHRVQKINLVVRESRPGQSGIFQVSKINAVRAASPDQEYTLTNPGKYAFMVSLLVFERKTVSELVDQYRGFRNDQAFLEHVLKDCTDVYYTEQTINQMYFLTEDGTFRTGFLTDSDPSILRVRSGESVTFTLPEAEDGKLYRILIDPSERMIGNYDILIDSTVESTNSDPVFCDVSDTAYYAEPVNWAIKHGITTGTTETTFSPDATCTKAQILTFLWRANGQPAPAVSNPFTDVSEGDYFYQAALWAYEKGLVEGGVFNESQPCTRAMTVTYLWKLAGSPEAMPSSFSDVDSTAEYAAAVAWAVSEGITNGTSETNFSPLATCTRAQIVTLLYRAIGG